MSEKLPGHVSATPDASVRNHTEEKRHALAEKFAGVAPGIMRARNAFMRDLPELLKNPNFDRWSVAYHGDERIAFSSSQRDVIRECLKRGLKDDEYFIGMVVPYDDEEWEIDQSLVEFDEME